MKMNLFERIFRLVRPSGFAETLSSLQEFEQRITEMRAGVILIPHKSAEIQRAIQTRETAEDENHERYEVWPRKTMEENFRLQELCAKQHILIKDMRSALWKRIARLEALERGTRSAEKIATGGKA